MAFPVRPQQFLPDVSFALFQMQQAGAPFQSSFSRQALAVIHVGFALTGVVTTMLGPMLPGLQSRWSLDDAQAGYLFTAQFASSIIATAVLSKAIRRLGVMRSMAAGYLLMALGAAGLGAGSFFLGILAVICYGFGLGLSVPATNILISQMNPEQRAARLNILNFIWCAGAVVCPAAVALFGREGRLVALLAVLALMLAAIAGLLQLGSLNQSSLVDKMLPHARRQGRGAQAPILVAQPFVSVWRTPFAYVLAALIFLYVGAENSIAGWVAAYMGRMNPATESLQSLPQSLFWAALLAGRLSAPVALKRLSEERLVFAALTLSMIGTSLLLISTGVVGLLVGVTLAGAGFAAIYPTSVAIFMKHGGERAAESSPPIFAMGGFGGATLPWVVGFVSKELGSLRAGLVVPLVVNAAMIALEIIIMVMLSRASVASKDKR